jgi:hypothetical protein
MYCQNCGHESHCHGALWKAVDFKEPDKVIKACDNCRCNNCTPKQKDHQHG